MAVKEYVNGAWQDASSLKQYVNNAWTNSGEAKIYRNSAWEKVYPTETVLYDRDTSISITAKPSHEEDGWEPGTASETILYLNKTSDVPIIGKMYVQLTIPSYTFKNPTSEYSWFAPHVYMWHRKSTSGMVHDGYTYSTLVSQNGNVYTYKMDEPTADFLSYNDSYGTYTLRLRAGCPVGGQTIVNLSHFKIYTN